MGMGGSVDDIWEKLKASSAPSQHALKAKRLLRGVHAGESTSRGAPSQSSRSASQGTGRGTTAARGDGQDGSREPPSAPSTSDPTPEPEAVSPSPANFADLEDLERGLARDLNSLADTQAPASTRLRSLRVLRGVIDTLDANLLREASLVSFAKPLLRRFEDASEQCREEATDAFTALTIRLESAVDLLPYAVPVLRTRAGPAVPEGKDPKEPSEEVRAKLHHLLVNLLTKGPAECEYFAPEAVDILEFAVEDSHADVAVLACESLEVLVRHLGRRLAPVSKNLAWMFFPNLTHRRAKVRVATLRAIRGLMHCGAHETILDLVAFQHPNLVPVKAFYGDDQKVNYFGKLATDGNVQVRCEFVRVIGDWMTTLIERLDHESRLLPYVISALTDEADVVQKEAMDLMDRLGVQYEKEHEKDLKKLMYYMPEAFGEDLYGVGEDALTLPPPFTKRPRLGSRILIKNNFKSVVNPVIGEMSSWQIELRAKAAVLLRTMLVFLEDNALQHVSHLCDAFISASKDDAVVREVKECCKLVGRFVRPGDWMGPLLERLRGSSFNDTAGRVGALAVLAGCLSGAAKDAMEERDEQESERSNCDDVLEALEDRSISGSADTKLRIQLCELVSTCAREKPATWRSRGSRLCALAIRAGGGEIGARDGSAAHMESAVAALATACGHASGADLIGSIRSELIAPLRSLPAFGWRAPDVAVLAAAAEAPGKCTPADAADLVRLSSLVAERPPAEGVRSRLLAFPFVSRGQLSAPLEDGDVQLLLGAALPPVATEPGGSFTVAALAAVAAALDPVNSSDAAAREAASLVACHVASILESEAAPANVRCDAANVLEGLAGREGAMEPRGVVAHALPALRSRLDDPNAGVRASASRTLAAVAATSPLAAYHAVRAALQPHLVAAGDCAAVEVTRAAIASHPSASRAAVHASGLSSDALKSLGESSGVELTGDWSRADVDGFDTALDATVDADEAQAAAQAMARLAAVGIDAGNTPVAEGDAVVEEAEPKEELFDLD